MRLNFASSLLSFDLWLFEQPDTDTDVRAVAGSPWPADSTIAASFDPLAQVDELPGDRHRTGFTA